MSDLIVNPLFQTTDDYSTQDLNNIVRAYANNDQVLAQILGALQSVFTTVSGNPGILTPDEVRDIINDMLDLGIVFDDPASSPYIPSRHDSIVPESDPRHAGEVAALLKKEPWVSLIMGADLQANIALTRIQMFSLIEGLLFWVVDGTHYSAKPIKVRNSTDEGFLLRLTNADGDYLVVDDAGVPILDTQGNQVYEPLPLGGSFISLLTYRIKRIMAGHLRTLYRVSAFEAGLSSNTTDLAGTYLNRQIAWDASTINEDRRSPPLVSAGSSRFLMSVGEVTLAGSYGTDGLDGPATSTWAMVSGPAPVVFDNSNDPKTKATFSAIGTYQLRLVVSTDTLSASDETTYVVQDVAVGTLPDGFEGDGTGTGSVVIDSQYLGSDQYLLEGSTDPFNFYQDNFVYLRHASRIEDHETIVRLIQPPWGLTSPASPVPFAGIMVRNDDYPTDCLIAIGMNELGEGTILYRDLHHRMVQRESITLAGEWLKITMEQTVGKFAKAEVWSSPDGISWTSHGDYSYRKPKNSIKSGMFLHSPGMALQAVFENYRSSSYGSNTQVTPKVSAGKTFQAIVGQPIQIAGIMAHDTDFGTPIIFWQSFPASAVEFDNTGVIQPTITINNVGTYRLIMQAWVPGGNATETSEVLVNVVSTALSDEFKIPKRFSCGWVEKGAFRFLRQDANLYAREIDVSLLDPVNGGSVENTFIQEESIVSLPMGLIRIPKCLIRFNGQKVYDNEVAVLTLHTELRVMNDPMDTGWQEPWNAGDIEIVPIKKTVGIGVEDMPITGILTGTQKQTLDVVGTWKYQHGCVIGHIVDGQARYVAIRLSIRRWAVDPAEMFTYFREVSSNSSLDELRRININSTDYDTGVWHSLGLSARLLGQFLSFKYADFAWDTEQLVSATVYPADLDTVDGIRSYQSDIFLAAHLTKNDRQFNLSNINGCRNTFGDAWSIRRFSSVQLAQSTAMLSDNNNGIENFPQSFEGSRAIIYLSNGEVRITQITQKIGDVLALFPSGDLDGVLPGDTVVIDRQVTEESINGTYRNEADAKTIIDLRPMSISPVDTELKLLPMVGSPYRDPAASPYEANPGPGDYEVNRLVSRPDVNDFLVNWGRNELETGFQAVMDLDGSGTLDFQDMNLLVQLYGASYSPEMSLLASPLGSPAFPPLPQWFLQRTAQMEILRRAVEGFYSTIPTAIESICRYNYDQRIIQKASDYRKVVDLRETSTGLKDFLLEWINNWESNRDKPWIRDEGLLIHWPQKNFEVTGRRETEVPLTRYDTNSVAGEDDRIVISHRDGWGEIPQLIKQWNSQDHIRYPTRVDTGLTFVSEKSFIIPGHTKLAGTFSLNPEDTHIVDPLVKVTLTQTKIVSGVKEEVYLGSFDLELGKPSSFTNVEGVFVLDGDSSYNPVTNRIRINYSSVIDFSSDTPGTITFAYSYNDLGLIHPLFQFSPRDMGLEVSHLADAKMYIQELGKLQRLTIPNPLDPTNDTIRITPILRLEGISTKGNDVVIRWNRDDIQKALGQNGIIRSWWVLRGLPWIEIGEVTYDEFGKAVDVEYAAWWVDEQGTTTFSINDDERCQCFYDPCLIKYAWVDSVQSNIHTEAFPASLNPRYTFYQKQPFQAGDGSLLLASTTRSVQFVMSLPPQDYRWTQVWDLSTSGKEPLSSMAVLTDKRTGQGHVVFGVFRDGINAGSTVVLSDEMTLGTAGLQGRVYFRVGAWMDDITQFRLDFVGMLTVISDSSLTGLRTNNKLQAYGYWYAGHTDKEVVGLINNFGADGIVVDTVNLPVATENWRHGDVPHAYLYRWNNLFQIGRDLNRPGAP